MLCSKRCSYLSICLFVLYISPLPAEEPVLQEVLKKVGSSKGVCSVPNCGDGSLAIAIAQQTGFLVHGFDDDRAKVDQAIKNAGRLGIPLQIEWIKCGSLPYADNSIDVVITENLRLIQADDVLRVLRPKGCVALRSGMEMCRSLEEAGCKVLETRRDWTILQKPTTMGADDWSHWSHGPDNNPVSNDSVIQAPYLSQWFAKPYYHAMPVVSTAARGRIFVASGHIAHHDREISTLNTLVARNGYNGRVLWQRKLPQGYLVHRSAFIATDDVFFMIEGNGILQLDAETGAELQRITIPGVAGTPVWIAKIDDVLYILASEDEPPTEVMTVHADWRGWGWHNVDKNYSPKNRHQIRWGFGQTIAAFDLHKMKLIWKHKESNIDSRGMGILGDRLLYYVPGKQLVCLSRSTGKQKWKNEDHEHLALIEEEAQGLAGTPGFRTETMLLATPVGLFIQGQKRSNVLAFALDDGQFMWTKKKFHNNPNMLYADGRLYISGLEQSGSVQEIDPSTGDTLEELNFWKGSCTRLTGSPEALYCRGEGFGRYDFEKKLYQSERSARPGCNDGAIPANGLLYVGPWLCDCNLSILGQMTLGPANSFKAHTQHLSNEHLETVTVGASEDTIAIDAQDWPTYRSNKHRSGASAAVVPSTARVLWHYKPRQGDIRQSQPVTAGHLVFTGGDDGRIRCFDAKTGSERWVFPTGAPVIASPTVGESRVFVGSGDGCVYCLDAVSGGLIWRFRVAPIERRIMLYGRLASTWPVNSGVLIHDGIVYAAAGLVFRDGTHVVALDSKTGELIWHNGGVGLPENNRFELRAASAAGTLAIGGNRLWMASGNVVAPVSFDLKTGKADVVAAERVPEWNTVMAQKPEPSGKDIMVFDDRILLHGGRLLYSGEGHVVTSAQFNFRAMGESGRLQGPAFTPVRYCAVPPVWDDDIFIAPTSRYGRMVVWKRSEVEQHLRDALALMVEMDKKIPGDTPQKWGQYNQIGKVFSTVERGLQSTSQWSMPPVDVYALATTKNAIVLVERSRGAKLQDSAAAYTKTEGRALWRVNLSCRPRLGCLAVNRFGHILLTATDGSLVCIGD